MAHATIVAWAVRLVVGAGCWQVGAGAAQSPSGVQVERAGGTLRYTNRLIDEKSPYLQLHAHNPVDWYPWGPEAFEKARRDGRPIFLSIGDSTCHWCHVMEAESFADPGIAELMNRTVVAIKVDREERPDVDRVYMSYVLATTGGGAWPLSVFLTPDLKPFLGGTYFPRDDDRGRTGFRTVLTRVDRQWTRDREQVIRAANAAARTLVSQAAKGGAADKINARLLERIYGDLERTYDTANGGFGAAPKFSRPAVLNFLFRRYARTGQKAALDMALHSLSAMADGGIHDQLGGGFHRYSTDRAWHVPHFEKMLYDQAQLAASYIDAYQITRSAVYAEAARDTLDYVLRDLRDPAGGFFSAEDADSESEAGGQAEGAFYVWKAATIRELLGRDAAEMFNFRYGVTEAGNVPAGTDGSGAMKGQNVLIAWHTMAELALKFKRPEAEVRASLLAARLRLAKARSERPRPRRDDKVLVAWNGMMISAFARAAQALDAPEYLNAAAAAAEFIRSRMYDADANLLKRR